jgi:hypothetical protein
VEGRENRTPVQQIGFDAYESADDPVKETYTWTDWYGDAPIENAGIDRKLTSAFIDQPPEVDGSSCTYDPMTEEEYCRELGPKIADAGVFWTGSGALSKVRENSRETGPGGTFSVKYRASSRRPRGRRDGRRYGARGQLRRRVRHDRRRVADGHDPSAR